ncbi:type II toxin-antitoxin system RelE/ParE family toxin [Helicobacter sp. UBA3407]
MWQAETLKRIITLHCFIKKEQKIPKNEIEKAREKLKIL